MAGTWAGPAGSPASFSGKYAGPSQPWNLFSADVKISHGNPKAFVASISRNSSTSSRTTQFFARLTDEKEVKTLTLTSCQGEGNRLVFSRLVEAVDRSGVKYMNTEYFILALSEGELLIGFEHGDAYCLIGGEMQACGSGNYEPYRLRAKN